MRTLIGVAFPLALLFVLSMSDAVCTALALSSGKYYELNPIMAHAWAYGPMTFMLSKLILTSVACVIFWAHWQYKSVKRITWFVLSLYIGINLFHAWVFVTLGY